MFDWPRVWMESIREAAEHLPVVIPLVKARWL